MNIILFEPQEWQNDLSPQDERVQHVHKILKSKVGDTLSAGVINESLGEAIISDIKEDGSISFDYKAHDETLTPLSKLALIIGTPRPPTAKRLIRDLATVGVGRIIFVATDLGEKSYLTSRLWSKGEYKDALLLGASQSKSPLLPHIEKHYSLYKAIDQLSPETVKLGLDNVNPDVKLGEYRASSPDNEVCLAIGPERGWSDREREVFKEKGFRICSLGNRVLRTETICHMASALILSELGYI